MLLDGEFRAHDQRMLVDVEEEFAVRIDGKGMAHGGDFRPGGGGWGVAQVVAGFVGKEEGIVF